MVKAFFNSISTGIGRPRGLAERLCARGSFLRQPCKKARIHEAFLAATRWVHAVEFSAGARLSLFFHKVFHNLFHILC
jgi:hypothetical protein